MIPGWVWRWELTPLEAFRGFKFWRMSEGESVSGEGRSFCCRRLPPCSLTGHGNLTYQFGVAASAPATGQVHAPFILGLREAQPTLPITGDRRSGVIVLDGERVVGSYNIDGRDARPNHRLVVHPDYRGRGLGRAMLHEWYSRTKRPRVQDPQRMNVYGVPSFLAAQVDITRWAVRTGKQVPHHVQVSLVQNEAKIQLAADEVARTGVAAVIG